MADLGCRVLCQSSEFMIMFIIIIIILIIRYCKIIITFQQEEEDSSKAREEQDFLKALTNGGQNILHLDKFGVDAADKVIQFWLKKKNKGSRQRRKNIK